MKIRLKRGLLGVPVGTEGEALGFRVMHLPHDGHNANSDEVIFTCTFKGYPNFFTLTWTSIESVR